MRSLCLGNGVLNVTYDEHGQIMDVYYPNTGMENQTSGNPQRIGFCVNGSFYWATDANSFTDYVDNAMVGRTLLRLDSVEFVFKDFIDRTEPVLTRIIEIRNNGESACKVRVFMHHDFSLFDNPYGDTALFDPQTSCMIHYKGRRYMASCLKGASGQRFDQYAVGKKSRNESATTVSGTFLDALDCRLSMNPIQQGAVDSVFSIEVNVEPKSAEKLYYWLAAAKSYGGIIRNSTRFHPDQAELGLAMTSAYWSKWISRKRILNLPEDFCRLYDRSLILIMSQTDRNGPIVASTDFSIQKGSHDTYNYVWPRDAAYTANAMDRAGYPSVSLKFFEFCSRLITSRGYLMQKYNPNGSLASSWHPWIKETEDYLPIQEDETALTAWAIAQHYLIHRDIEQVIPFYRNVLVPACKFLVEFTEHGLPKPSYDLWEERFGIHIHTASTVYAALRDASRVASEMGDDSFSKLCSSKAEEMRTSIVTKMAFDGRFIRRLYSGEGEEQMVDRTVDSTLITPALMGVVDPQSSIAQKSAETVEAKLTCPKGGIARYEGDKYMRGSPIHSGNPWVVTTMWLAQYFIIRNSGNDRRKAMDLISWVVRRALPSGVLAEQFDPETNAPISVAPLTWSHAEFLRTIQLIAEI